jgi:hypothetical protein
MSRNSAGRTFADADSPNWRQHRRRVQSDLDFIKWLRTATRDDLVRAIPAKPRWRDEAIRRRLAMTP